MDSGIQIVKQAQTTEQDATGAFVPAVRVTFTVDGQGPFSVSVPVSQFSADTVNKLVSDYAAHVRDVGKLGQ